MEEQTNEETPQAGELMYEDEEEEEEEEVEELTDAEIVELEETVNEAQVDVAVNVELGDDTVTETDADEEPPEEMHTAKEVTEVSLVKHEIHPIPEQGSGSGLILEEGDDDVDRPATPASKDQLDVLEAPASAPTVSADTVAPEDEPSQPDTVGSDVRLGRYTAADYDEEVEVVDERAKYADADITDEEIKVEPPTVEVEGPHHVSGVTL